MGVYRVSKQLWFCAAHQVRLSEDRCEDLHGHNYRLVVHAEARELDRTTTGAPSVCANDAKARGPE